MRLSPQQKQTIQVLVRENLGPEACTTLFGSRTDDTAIGGDIDLLVELPARVALATEIRLSAKLEQALGTPVDLITTYTGAPSRPIVELAQLTGTPL